MEIRDFALQVLTAEDLDLKLAPPPGAAVANVASIELTDDAPGSSVRERAPGRPIDLRIRGSVKVPAIDGMGDPALRPPGSRPVRLVAWGFPTRQASSPVPADEPSAGDQ